MSDDHILKCTLDYLEAAILPLAIWSDLNAARKPHIVILRVDTEINDALMLLSLLVEFAIEASSLEHFVEHPSIEFHLRLSH